MDIEEWEILPHGGFLDYPEDGEKKSSSASNRSSNSKSGFNMNYFVCPSSPPRNSSVVPNQLVPVPFQLETTRITTGDRQEDKSKPIDIRVMPSVIMPEAKGPDIAPKEADQDPVSQVFFKKMKENEFVDMKMDSPKSPTTKSFVPPQIDASKFDFEDKGDTLEAKISSPRIKIEKEIKEVEEIHWEENNGGLNLWKWSLNGIGAICSFGVAAATVCIIIFGSHQRNKQQQNQKLRFQIYNEDKRIKQVVHHATRFNEAIATVRGVPIARAHITFGGYYDGV
ncbi:uncharacterized protein LOC110621397 [Manihot esculenta]|uniref:DUF6821 domain-containing protein n=1 Tax=Manihot esculenta TaxID=3983 RepID=A0A2C9VGA3_MANES|nr:uncharacterized protein LOC110621397 [Manihot esculenta]OAY44379.1 hypothetical protein MANES_08G145000v8 [Manihot esculenta]